MSGQASILETTIDFLKGVGPQKGELLRKELGIQTYADLLEHFPYRHVDKTRVFPISAISPQLETVQVKGILGEFEEMGAGKARRLTASLYDGSGSVELTWFQGINWVKKTLRPGTPYLVFGRPGWFRNTPQLMHPEIEPVEPETAAGKDFLEPVYPTTEKLKARFVTGRAIGKLTQQLLPHITSATIPEILPDKLVTGLKLMPRCAAFRNLHFPPDNESYQQALRRLKFEELFLLQLRLNQIKLKRHLSSKSYVFEKVGEQFNLFYHHHLPFGLTNAQKRVIKEIRNDCGKGRQMNRLLQGDVGSGKTIVALLSMLLAIDNGYQCCLMAPTEILARQHYASIRSLLKDMPLEVEFLSGSVKTKQRREVLEKTASGQTAILIGTHALIEDPVQFKKLGFVVIDEQHRFGVEQRSKLWKKSELPPHVLVMTATPIPRTLSMTLFGDLDISIIDELPPGRKPITTVHRFETSRINVLDFVKQEIEQGRQAYIIFPLIEESEKLDYENLMQGFEHIKSFFPEPQFLLSMVHGRMPADLKETNMRRFVTGKTQIMVSTTVIEVGVNVPNATVMVIENAEKFGLSQLHQLRGRVGRGSEKSYCILLTSSKLTQEARSRIKILTETNDGFKIAEKDLELRGPGEIDGTRQSGMLNFKLASLVNDKELMQEAAFWAEKLLDEDANLQSPENRNLLGFLTQKKHKTFWAKIS